MRFRHLLPAIGAAAVLSQPAARAQTVTPPESFTAFTVQSATDNSTAESSPLVLLSDADGQTVFSLPNLMAFTLESTGTQAFSEYIAGIYIGPQAGYVITSFELTGLVSGELEVGVPPVGTVDVEGEALNEAYFALNTGPDGAWRASNTDGTRSFEFILPPGATWPAPDGLREVRIWTIFGADARDTRYSWVEDGVTYSSSAPSYASLAVPEARLTVHWALAPIPEPHAWLMLAVGLLPLAALRLAGRGPGQRGQQPAPAGQCPSRPELDEGPLGRQERANAQG